MTRIYFEIATACIAVDCPPMLVAVLRTCWPHAVAESSNVDPVTTITIDAVAENRWTIAVGDADPIGPVEKADFVLALAQIVKDAMAEAQVALPLSAGAVSWDGGDVLVLGAAGAGKSMLIAWLMSKGFALLSDNDLVWDVAQGGIAALGGPLTFAEGHAIETVRSLPDFADCLHLKADDTSVLVSHPEWVLPMQAEPPALLVFVDHNRASGCQITPLTPDDVTAKVGNLLLDMPVDTKDAVVSYLKGIPAIFLSYAEYPEIEHLVDQLCFYAISVAPSPDIFAGYLQKISGSNATAHKVSQIPERTDRDLSPRLTIGMATYDDYDGVYFSLQAIRLYHPEILDQVEFLVVDNNPEGVCAEALKKLENHIPNYRYIPTTGIKGTAVRDYIFREAYGEYVLSMDCHVFFVPGALKRLLDYYTTFPETNDLLQGPLLADDLETTSTHFVPRWEKGMYGCWSDGEKGFDADAEPFEIPSQGLGIFTCRKAAWPGFNPAFQGFGGEEGYIHEKFRKLGHKALCLPFLQWMHRFERPFGVAYRNNWEDRIRNYAIGWAEVDLPMDEMRAHFVEMTNEQVVASVFRRLAKEKAPYALL